MSIQKVKQTLVRFHRKFLTLFRTLHGKVYCIFGALQNAGTWRVVLNRAEFQTKPMARHR